MKKTAKPGGMTLNTFCLLKKKNEYMFKKNWLLGNLTNLNKYCADDEFLQIYSNFINDIHGVITENKKMFGFNGQKIVERIKTLVSGYYLEFLKHSLDIELFENKCEVNVCSLSGSLLRHKFNDLWIEFRDVNA